MLAKLISALNKAGFSVEFDPTLDNMIICSIRGVNSNMLFTQGINEDNAEYAFVVATANVVHPELKKVIEDATKS